MTGSGVTPDTKDWTWVLTRACPECGADVGGLDPSLIADAVRHNASGWATALGRGDVEVRPSAGVWSPLEYACHVRDVHRVFDGRLRSMLEQDDPVFDNWDQDADAAAYGEQPAAVVAADLAAAAHVVATRYDQVEGAQWSRPGRRSNGSVFTVASLGRYHLHDVVHHLADVGGEPPG